MFHASMNIPFNVYLFYLRYNVFKHFGNFF